MPVLEINLAKIKQNTTNIKKYLNGIELVGVVKGCQGDAHIAKAMVNGGAEVLADSRIANLVGLKDFPIKKMLLRVPLNDEPRHLLRCVDLVMVSNLSDIDRLGKIQLGEIHGGKSEIGLILNVETGFGREGIKPRQLKKVLTKANMLTSPYYLAGFATNTACRNANNPLNQLNLFVNIIRPFIDFQLPTSHFPLIVSGGNSSVLPWALEKKLPKEINQLRIGEAILLGHETIKYKPVASNSTDAFKIKADVIQLNKNKKETKAIIAIGYQDIGAGKLKPVEKGVKMTGEMYSEYCKVEVSGNTKLGQVVYFQPDYYAMLALMASPYVRKEYLRRRPIAIL